LRTADAVSSRLTGGEVAFSMALFMAVYCALFGAFLWFLLFMIRKGPKSGVPDAPPERAASTQPAFYG
jgi:cytochrome d ubiquinol oxidase subunit I